MIYNFFYIKSIGKGVMSNQQLAIELHKTIIRKFKKRRVFSSFNTWCVDLTNIQLISKYNKGIRYLLCVINPFSKYELIAPLKDK